MDLVESIINSVARVLSSDSYRSHDSTTTRSDGNDDSHSDDDMNQNQNEIDMSNDAEGDIKMNTGDDGWDEHINMNDTQNTSPISIAREVVQQTNDIHHVPNGNNITMAHQPQEQVRDQEREMQLQLLRGGGQQHHEGEHNVNLRRNGVDGGIEGVFSNDGNHVNDGEDEVGGVGMGIHNIVNSILSDESECSSDSDADDLLVSLSNHKDTTGHVTQQAHLWSDGLMHPPGQCKDCDTVRLKEQELLFQQLVTVYYCDICEAEKKYTNIPSVPSSLSSPGITSHQCIGVVLEDALDKYVPTDVIPLILYFANGEVKPTTSFVMHPLLNVSQKLFQCIVEKITTNRYEMRIHVKSNDMIQALRGRMFHTLDQIYNNNTSLVDEMTGLSNRLTAFGRRIVRVCTIKYNKLSVLYAINALFLNEDITLLGCEGKNKWNGNHIAYIYHVNNMYHYDNLNNTGNTKYAEQNALITMASNSNSTQYTITSNDKHMIEMYSSKSVDERSHRTRSISTSDLSTDGPVVIESITLRNAVLSAQNADRISTSVLPKRIKSKYRVFGRYSISCNSSAGSGNGVNHTSANSAKQSIDLGEIKFSHYERNGGPRKLNLSLLHDAETRQRIHLKYLNDAASASASASVPGRGAGAATSAVAPNLPNTSSSSTASAMVEYENIKPQWHNDISAHVLHFNYNRVKEKSVKNLKLVSAKRASPDNGVDAIHSHTIFQFGRERVRSTFILDFIYPLSPLQAFAIAISSIECKL